MSDKRRFIYNSLLFLLGTGLSKALSIILLPLYTSLIPTSDYGAYDVSITVITIVSSVAYFEIWAAVLRYMYDFSTPAGQAKVIKAGSILFLGATLLFTLMSSVICSIFRLAMPGLLIGYGIATSAASFFCFVARGCNKNREFTVSGIINSMVITIISIILLVIFHFDFSALYISSICGSVTQCIYLAYVVKFYSVLKRGACDTSLTRELLSFAAPLCLNTASYWLLSSASRLVFNYLCGDSASGLFSVGNKFGQVMILATTCFTYAWQDLSFSRSSANETRGDFYTRACRKYLVFLTASYSLLLPAVALLFPAFVKGDYGESFNMIPLALIVALLNGYSGFVGNIFYAIKKTRTITVSAIVGGITAVLSSPLFIHFFWANGVNCSVALGFIVNIIIRAIILRKKTGFKLEMRVALLCIFWIIVTSIAFYFATSICIIIIIINVALTCWLFRTDIGDALHHFRKAQAQKD